MLLGHLIFQRCNLYSWFYLWYVFLEKKLTTHNFLSLIDFIHLTIFLANYHVPSPLLGIRDRELNKANRQGHVYWTKNTFLWMAVYTSPGTSPVPVFHGKTSQGILKSRKEEIFMGSYYVYSSIQGTINFVIFHGNH